MLILLNQSDGLRVEQRASLRAYVEQQLAKYGLAAGLPVAPMFISGKDAWSARSQRQAVPAEFAEMEDAR